MIEKASPFDDSNGEKEESPKEHRELLIKLGDAIGRTCVAYFTSHKYPVAIDQTDADMLEEVLRTTTLRNGLCLVLDTPGGDGISAERIVRICRVYSDNKFDVFVARRAKSAGTIIAMGANRIFMGETSSLGRIDPQILVHNNHGAQSLMPAHVVITSFDDLMNKTATLKGNLKIHLQQLGSYDIKQIELIRRQLKMTEDIAVKCLKQGMLSRFSRKDIKRKIRPFLSPSVTKAHVRDIFFNEAHKTGLNVELVHHSSPTWDIASELYVKVWDYVTSSHCKLIESPDYRFSLPWKVDD
jgi:hypothetical protein